MHAIVWNRYGGPDTLSVETLDKPEPKPGEVRIRLDATTVSAGDGEMRSLKLRFPRTWPCRLPLPCHLEGWRRSSI